MTRPAKRKSIPLGRGWSVALRRDEVYPDDPGNGTPAMVCGPFGKSATFWCAADTGYVTDRNGEDFVLPGSVNRRIDAVADEVNAYVEAVTQWLKETAT